MITSLSFGAKPDQEKWSEITKGRRLIQLYLNDKDDVKAGDLELAFNNYTNHDDAWKLGL